MSRRPTGTATNPHYRMEAASVRRLTMALTFAFSLLPCVTSAANKDLVILHSERWIDTLKGTVKNVSAKRADEVVIVVRLLGETRSHVGPYRRKPTHRQELGRQTVKVVALDPGQEAPFEVEIAEKYRMATSFTFEPHAIWDARVRARSGGR